jgi:tetratricopeptide (TPR) repeat protein/predicted protein tyrosine phosphatase
MGRQSIAMLSALRKCWEKFRENSKFKRESNRFCIDVPDSTHYVNDDELISYLFDRWQIISEIWGGMEDGYIHELNRALCDCLQGDADADVGEMVQNGGCSPFLDFEMQEALVRHLAVISVPVTAGVLTYCPQIASILRERKGTASDFNGEKYVESCLNTLHRVKRIVFAMEQDSHQKMERRFQVHRSIQHYIYRRLGTQASPPGDGYHFAPSLYVSQARDLPRLHASSYGFLYELVDALSGYPTLASRKINDQHRLQCLRAAMGVVRTLFSVGVVSRFGQVGSIATPRGADIGHLEHHRLVVRWMLHVASRSCPDTSGAASQPSGTAAGAPEDWPPFYRDETVWLLNEAGVFSLAQGRTMDAAALFRLAIEENRKIDGEDGMATRRLFLNDGLCCIDRGRLKMARRRFEAVRAAKGETPIVIGVAMGFRGLVDHLEGHYAAALAAYEEALQNLEGGGRMRSASFIRRHRADLLRRMGRPEEAARDLERALHAADVGGYDDFRHFAELSEVRLWFTLRERIPQALERLDQAEIYADRMDMPRLKVEILRTRAEILLQQGESRIAGDIAIEAIRIANLNHLVLRRITCTQLLSRIYRRQGDERSANHLKAVAQRAARTVGYLLVPHPED